MKERSCSLFQVVQTKLYVKQVGDAKFQVQQPTASSVPTVLRYSGVRWAWVQDTSQIRQYIVLSECTNCDPTMYLLEVTSTLSPHNGPNKSRSNSDASKNSIKNREVPLLLRALAATIWSWRKIPELKDVAVSVLILLLILKGEWMGRASLQNTAFNWLSLRKRYMNVRGCIFNLLPLTLTS